MTSEKLHNLNRRRNLFGEYLQSLRHSVGFSIPEAASKLNQTQDTLKAWESGQTLPPKQISKILCPLYNIREQEWLEVLAVETQVRQTSESL